MSAKSAPSVHLRSYRLDDVDQLALLLNDPDVTAMTSSIPYPYARSDAEAFLSRVVGEESEFANRAVVGADDTVRGGIGLRVREGVEELGYWVGKPYWNQGIATRAVALYIDVLADAGHTGALFAQTLTDNVASQKVLLANGFVYQGGGKCETPARATASQPSKRYLLER